jgi:hypothetical protein
MEIRNNGTRFYNYDTWEDKKHCPYNYAKNGLLKYIMSNQIVNTNNPALKILLQFVESSLFFVMKYTDMLKNFKNIHCKNR